MRVKEITALTEQWPALLTTLRELLKIVATYQGEPGNTTINQQHVLTLNALVDKGFLTRIGEISGQYEFYKPTEKIAKVFLTFRNRLSLTVLVRKLLGKVGTGPIPGC